jgi:hypothetical protein
MEDYNIHTKTTWLQEYGMEDAFLTKQLKKNSCSDLLGLEVGNVSDWFLKQVL